MVPEISPGLVRVNLCTPSGSNNASLRDYSGKRPPGTSMTGPETMHGWTNGEL